MKMPRRSRRLNPPCLLDGLSDDLVLRVFSRSRAPPAFMTHGFVNSGGEPVIDVILVSA